MDISPYLYQMWTANQVTGLYYVGKAMKIWGVWEEEVFLWTFYQSVRLQQIHF